MRFLQSELWDNRDLTDKINSRENETNRPGSDINLGENEIDRSENDINLGENEIN